MSSSKNVSIEPEVVHVCDRCEIVRDTEGVVVFVDDDPLLSFDQDDIAARKLAMVQLAIHHVATQVQIAAAFRVKPVTVARAIKDYRKGGVAALIPKKIGAPLGCKMRRHKENSANTPTSASEDSSEEDWPLSTHC
jgi:hypothetical protein